MHSTPFATDFNKRQSLHDSGNLTPIEQYPLSIPIVPNQYTMEDQIIDNTSHDTTIYEGKEDYYYDDDYDTSDASYRDFNKFISEFYQVEAQGFDLSPRSRKIFFNNGLNTLYAIQNCDNNTDPIPEKIGSIIESWFSEKLTYNGEIGESIPILQESPRILAEGIMIKLRKSICAFHGLSKVLISIRAGHAYLLHMIGDEIIMEPHYKNFYEQFPLFVDVTIKVQKERVCSHNNSCQVLVTVEHATYKEENCDVPRCYGNESDNQRQNFRSFNTRMITTSSADGQMFCLLEKVL